MKIYINLLVCLSIIVSSFQVLASTQPSTPNSQYTDILDSKVMAARSLGEQIKILDTRKLATEKFIQDRNTTILKNSRDKALKATGYFLACSVLCTVGFAVIAPPFLIMTAGAVNAVKNEIAFALADRLGALVLSGVLAAYLVSPFVLAYMGYKAEDSTLWSKQISKLEDMSDAQVMAEYEGILSQGKSLIEQVRNL